MDTKLMNVFIAGTETNPQTAFHYLINNNWDIPSAIDDYATTHQSLVAAADLLGTYLVHFWNLIIK